MSFVFQCNTSNSNNISVQWCSQEELCLTISNMKLALLVLFIFRNVRPTQILDRSVTGYPKRTLEKQLIETIFEEYDKDYDPTRIRLADQFENPTRHQHVLNFLENYILQKLGTSLKSISSYEKYKDCYTI